MEETTSAPTQENAPTRAEFQRLEMLIQEASEVSKENRHILHQMQFWGRVAFWAKAVAWVLILIGVPVLAYSFFQPFINFFIHGVAGVSGNAINLGGSAPK